MKRLLAGIGAVMLLALAPALADGIPSYKPPRIAAPYEAPAPYEWTGLYLGVGAGYGMSNADLGFDKMVNDNFVNQGGIDGLGFQGWRGDLKIGGDYRFSGFVAGIFGTWTPDGFGGTDFNASFENAHIGGSIQPTYSVGARFGVIAWGSSLVYAGVKHQWAKLDASSDLGSWSDSKDLRGWGVLAGIEAPITTNLTFGVEVNYVRFDEVTLWSDLDQNRLTVQPDDLSVMARLNFRTNLGSGIGR